LHTLTSKGKKGKGGERGQEKELTRKNTVDNVLLEKDDHLTGYL
jgi:hypothetical protein